MRNAFVAPGVPNGMPAVITTVSAVLASPSCWATVTARSTISETLETSRVWTQCAPQSSESRRPGPAAACRAGIEQLLASSRVGEADLEGSGACEGEVEILLVQLD